jgi:hypothetical protein
MVDLILANLPAHAHQLQVSGHGAAVHVRVWDNQPVPNVKRLSQKIQERACFIICTGPEFSEHAAASLVVWITELLICIFLS